MACLLNRQTRKLRVYRELSRCRRRDSNPRHADYDGPICRGFGSTTGTPVRLSAAESGSICRVGNTVWHTVPRRKPLAGGHPDRPAGSGSLRISGDLCPRVLTSGVVLVIIRQPAQNPTRTGPSGGGQVRPVAVLR